MAAAGLLALAYLLLVPVPKFEQIFAGLKLSVSLPARILFELSRFGGGYLCIALAIGILVAEWRMTHIPRKRMMARISIVMVCIAIIAGYGVLMLPLINFRIYTGIPPSPS